MDEWLSVFKSADCPKLRKLSCAIGCSKPEALGMLIFIWFWAMEDKSGNGLLENVTFDEIVAYLQWHGIGSSADMRVAVKAMIEIGWLDKTDNGYAVHDWLEWGGAGWNKYMKAKENAAKRKRNERERKKAHELLCTEAQPEEPAEATLPQEQAAKPPQDIKARKEPEKIRYADYVRMTEDEHKKLIGKYGEQFAATCIETLNNYKGSTGKKYKNDYLAICNWVVDRVKEKRPGLMQAQIDKIDEGQNPFANFGGC